MKKLLLGGLATTALILAACGGDASTASTSSKSDAPKAKKAAEKAEIRIVGSSTVYPFSTKVAQEYKNKTGQNVVVEATGSGGGHKLFCDGTAGTTPSMTNSSRRQKKSEFDL